MDDLTQRGIVALKAGDKALAYTLLHQAVQTDPDNETAWLWMAGAASDDEERRRCLKWVLALNPQNERARQGLLQLGASPASDPAAIRERIGELETVIVWQERLVQGLESSWARTIRKRKQEAIQHDIDRARKQLESDRIELSRLRAQIGMPAVTTAHHNAGQSERPPQKSTAQAGVIGLVILCVVAVCVVVSIFGKTGTSYDNPQWDAKYMCQQFMQDRLKAPSTAQFSPAGEQKIMDNGPDQYLVSGGYVDSDNSFGAKLRMTFSCNVRHLTDDQWQLVDITTSEDR